jgi:tetratricopeptide (TPR) repeat protein
MDLSQRIADFEASQLQGNGVEMVEKAVELANAYQQMRKFESAIATLNKIQPFAVVEASQHAVVETALGVAYWEKAQLQKALNHFKEALTLFEQVNDLSGQATLLSIVGITFWRKCDWHKALELLKGSLMQGLTVENRFVSLYGAFDRGIATLQNRVRLGRELQDPVKILQPLFSLCALYWVTGQAEPFNICLEESVMLAEQLGKADILQAAKGLKKLTD